MSVEQGQKIQVGNSVPLNEVPHNVIFGGVAGERTFRRADDGDRYPLGSLWEVVQNPEDGSWKVDTADKEGRYMKGGFWEPITAPVTIVSFIEEPAKSQK